MHTMLKRVYQTRGHTRHQRRGGVESWSGDNRLLGLLSLLLGL